MCPKVLFIDHDPSQTREYVQALRDEPVELLVAASCMEAMDLLGQGPVDILVLDESLPDLPLLEFIEQAGTVATGGMVMLITGVGEFEPTDMPSGPLRGCQFLKKPFTTEEFLEEIHQVLEKKQKALGQQQESSPDGRVNQPGNKQHTVVVELEKENPGITHVNKDESGTIIVDDTDCDMDALLEELAAIEAKEKKSSSEKPPISKE